MVAFAEPRTTRASRRCTPPVFRRRAIPGQRFSKPRKVMLVLTYFEHGGHGLVTKIKPLGGTEISFGYDALMRRVKMTEGDLVTYFKHDGLDLIEVTTSTGDIVKLIHGYTTIDGIGSVVEIQVNGTRYYLHQDHRGTTYKITNSSGDVVWTGTCDAWGNVISETGSNPSIFWYQGQAWWKLTVNGRLYYLSPTRIYDVADGRFIENDLISPAQQQYKYSRQNALSYADSVGLDAAIIAEGSDKSGHAAIAVQVRDDDDDHVLGWLSVDFFGKGYMRDRYGDGQGAEGGSSSASGSSSGSSGKGQEGSSNSSGSNGDSCGALSMQGMIGFVFRPAGVEFKRDRIVKGSVEQDRRLLETFLKDIGKDKAWFKEWLCKCRTETPSQACVLSPALEAQGEFATYRFLTQNCVDYVDRGLDVYLGYNWCAEPLITGPDDLLQQWDERMVTVSKDTSRYLRDERGYYMPSRYGKIYVGGGGGSIPPGARNAFGKRFPYLPR